MSPADDVVKDGSEVAPDGSPIQVYRRLPPMGEPEIVHAAIPAGATVLELGAGAGRVTMPLIALGHPVTAVDESPAMLSTIRGADIVKGDVRTLDLGRSFGAVLAASHLLNTPEPFRSAVLSTVRRHLAPGGVALFEVYAPGMDWPAAVGRLSRIGHVAVTVERAEVSGRRIDATVAYAIGGRTWRQAFVAEMLDEDDVRAELARAGLRFDRWLDRSKGWFAGSHLP